MGGDCTNVGCVPSKTLIHLANEQNSHIPDARAVFRVVQSKRDHLRDEETEMVQGVANLDFVRGRAELVGPKHVQVIREAGTQQRLSATTS